MSYRNAGSLLGKGVALGAAILVMLPVGSAAAGTAPVGKVRKAMEELAAVPGVVGAVGGAYVDGESVGEASGGSRFLWGGRIPADARFRIWSQTKQMVGTVVLQLVEEGRLGVDDTLGRVLPVVVKKDLVARGADITVRQMLQHTSGIPDWYAAPGGNPEDPSFDPFDFTTDYRPLDLVKWTRERPRTGEPGESYSYSSTNYTLLGLIVERVTGNDLATELHRRLFRPLGMTKTYLTRRPPEGIKGPHGHGYYPDANGRLRDIDRYNASLAGAGAGGVVSTARDASAYQRAFTRGELLPPDLQQILKPPLPPEQGRAGDDCGGQFKILGGTGPGSLAMTFSSDDGRRQLTVSLTLSVKDNSGPAQAVGKAVETVFC